MRLLTVFYILLKIFLVEGYYDGLARINANFTLDDGTLDTFSIVRKYGYPCEIHRAYTEDGYILEMHRIPHGLDGPDAKERPVAFLMHGLLTSSADWVLIKPGNGLAFLLADAGYDVWMGNARGNTYSRNHIYFQPKFKTFWKFSWHEIGYYDLPAMIDYILEDTNQSGLHYIGFSQGTTAFFVTTSTKPEYNDKIFSMHALAPIMFLKNVKSPLIRAIVPFTDILEFFIGTNEFFPNGLINILSGKAVCLEKAASQVLCSNLLFLVCGFDDNQLNKTMLPILFGHTPAGVSTRQLVHFGQLCQSNKFRKYDYGSFKNKIIYGTFKPPEYNLTKITTPIYLYYSENDWLSTPKNVEKLTKQVNSIKGIHKVGLKAFNHLDFIFAIEIKQLVYDYVLNNLNKLADNMR